MAAIAAKSYCEALFSIAEEEDKTKEYKEQLVFVVDTLKENKQFKAVLTHPKISRNEKKELLETIYGKEIDHMLLNFLKLLIDKNRFICLDDINRIYIKMFHTLNNIAAADIYSAQALSEDEIKRLTSMLEKKLNKNIELKLHIDEDLIAGIRIKIGDKVLDNTAKNRLQKLKETVVNADVSSEVR